MDKRKILIIYHRADYDGIFSAIIAKKYYESKGVRVETLGWNYGDDQDCFLTLSELELLVGRKIIDQMLNAVCL